MQKILVCDDEANIRNIMDFSLEAEGFVVVEAADGNEALLLAAKEQPDLVLLDVMMPGQDGLTVCRHLKENPATQHLPVLLLTARGNREDREAGVAAGADDYVTKPFSPGRVIEKINELLGARN